jgi:TRAP-type mannitol/chloroaromatic compound transport system substrate-binding protein
MDRRKFLATAGMAGAGAAAIAAPAIAQSQPEIKWRCTQAFPKVLDTLYGASETIGKYVAAATDGKFQIQTFAPGELVPVPGALDAVSNNTVECSLTAGYYYWGKDPVYALATTVPFMLNARQQNAWMYYGGGIDLMNEFFAKSGMIAFPAANTGAQMGGWFRKELKSLADFNGLKFRIGGFGGSVLQKLGVVPQNIPAGDIYPALERGTLDAVEFVGPYDDEKLGFYQVAPFYYYPGFWEGGAMLHLFINKAQYDKLPEPYKAALRTACQATNCDVLAKYDYVNPQALKSLAAKGAKLRAFPQDFMDASFEAAKQVYTDLSAKNADFKKIWDSIVKYRADAFLWEQIADFSFDFYMMQQQRANKL